MSGPVQKPVSLRKKLGTITTNEKPLEEPIIVPLNSEQFPPVGIADENAGIRVIHPGWENR